MALTTKWITDPATGELYFAIGPFPDREHAIPVQRVVMSCVGHPSYPDARGMKLRFEDGTLTQMGRAMLWMDEAGERGHTTTTLSERLGVTKEGANHVLRRLLEAGYVERVARVPGQHLVYRRV